VGLQLGAEHSQRLEPIFHAVPHQIVAVRHPTNAKGIEGRHPATTTRSSSFEQLLLYNSARNCSEGDYICTSTRRRCARNAATSRSLTYSRTVTTAPRPSTQLEAEGRRCDWIA